MKFNGIIISVLLGFVIIQFLLKKRNILIAFGLSGIVGLGIQTLIMFGLDALRIKFSASLVLFISVVLIIIFALLYYRLHKTILFSRQYFKGFSFSEEIGSINAIWMICLSISAYIVYIVCAKALFWPTYNADAMTSFDLYAKALAREGRLINSLILENRVGAGVTYPPLYSLGVSYYYQLGFTNPNIISVVFLLSFSISFYALTKTAVNNSTSAAFFTLMVITIPEFIAQCAVNITSCPQAIIVSLSIIALMVWYKDNSKVEYLNVSAVLLGFAGFIRSETIVYMLPLFIMLTALFFLKRNIQIRQIITYCIIASLPFLLWQLHLKVNAAIMDKFSQVELTKSFNNGHLSKIFDLALHVIGSTQYYGVSQFVIIPTLVMSVIAFRKDKKCMILFLIISASFFGYLLLLNQMELRFDNISNIVNYSGKRFFFGMFILLWFCLAYNYYTAQFFDKIHHLISRVNKPPLK